MYLVKVTGQVFIEILYDLLPPHQQPDRSIHAHTIVAIKVPGTWRHETGAAHRDTQLPGTVDAGHENAVLSPNVQGVLNRLLMDA